MEKEKVIIIVALIVSLTLASSVHAAATYVSGLYTNTYYFNLAGNKTAGKPLASFKSCNVDANFKAGDCMYLYACYAFLPKSSTSFSQALAKSCDQVTDFATYNLDVSVVPPIGGQYAVTAFITQLHYMYNGLSTTKTIPWTVYVSGNPTTSVPAYTWYINDTTLPIIIPSDIVAPCPVGQMLRCSGGTACQCYTAVSICANAFSSNMCTNAWDAYCLDYVGTLASPASNATVLNDCNANPTHICTDKQHDGMCDDSISYTCSDNQRCAGFGAGNLTTGANGICDESDTLYCGTQCVDIGPVAGGDGICDSVQGTCSNAAYIDQPRCVANGGIWTWISTVCPLIFNPVCWSQAASSGGKDGAGGCYAQADCAALGSTYTCIGSNVLTSVLGKCTNMITYPNSCFASAMNKLGTTPGACLPQTQLVQCYNDGNCPAISCTGKGSITATCINYACHYNGVCGVCLVASDCGSLTDVCAGIGYSCPTSCSNPIYTTQDTCQLAGFKWAGSCIVSGQCITKPEQPTSVWLYISGLFALFWNWIKSLLGWV